MIEYFYHQEEQKLTHVIRINKTIKQIQNRTFSNLNLIFKYTYLSDLKIIVGISEVSKGKFRFEVLDICTGLTIKPCRRASIAINRVLNLGHGDFIAECTPLDPILWDYIREKQMKIRRTKALKVKRDEYD